MNKGIQIAQGKTKVLYEQPGQPDVLVVAQTDAISAGDGAKQDVISGKGRLAAQTTARVFRLLNLCGLPSHYLSGGEDDDNNEMLVRRCNMIPLEVVVRGVAAGSLIRRNPGLQKGALLIPRMVEFFLKDDANHDPLIDPESIVSKGIASPAEIGAMSEMARITFDILSHAWRKKDTLLVDLKIEFGRLTGGENQGMLVIADVIDNDSWRIWPQAREDLMLDKQLYRNLDKASPDDLLRIKDAYESVADQVGSFPQMRPGMVAVICDGPEYVDSSNRLVQSLQMFGLPTVRHVASSIKTPGYVLQLVQQLDATFARLLFVSVGEPNSALRDMLDNATTNPVFHYSGTPEQVAMRCAKTLAMEDTVLFGRTLLMQTNSRSAIMQADAGVNASVPPNSTLA
ncbi:MAG: phosphoribosylaminoimidazolesuccinocarboxamide synthase [Candidatus Baltobacteraceae bacterium]